MAFSPAPGIVSDITAGELRNYRLMAVAGVLFVIGLGVLHRLVGWSRVDPLLPRAGMALLCALLWVRTYGTRTRTQRPVFQAGVYALTLWAVYLVWLNRFAPAYAMSLLIVVPGVSATFRSVRALAAYLALTNLTVLAAALATSRPFMSPAFIATDVAALTALSLITVSTTLRTERELARSRERYELAALGATDGLWDWDLVAGRMYYSPRWKSMLGYAEQEVAGDLEEWLGRVHPDDVEALRAELQAHLRGGTPHFQREYRIHDARGVWRWMLARGQAVRDAAGRATRMAGSQTDIGAWKQAEARLLHDSLHDPLTELPNRALFLDRLGRICEHGRRRPQYRFAVLFLDLDRFKHINDGLGHLVGDELLKIVARRLLLCVRQEDTVARLGGDEFAILLSDVRDLADATQVAQRVNESLQQPIQIGAHELFVSASVGVSLSAPVLSRPEDLMRDADTAMYRAKAAGGMRYEVEGGVVRTEAADRLRLEAELRRAVERGELRVQYQPIVELESRQLVGLEALLRWQHPERGLLMPDDFIPMAEETGIILGLDWWVLYRACEQAARWASAMTRPGQAPLTVSVNLSGKHFWQEDLVPRLDVVLEETGARPEHLRLEITESAVMRDAEAAARVLSAVRRRGLGLAIDDFGTGYSSLTYLQRFPVDTLKIDREFVARVADEPRSVELVRSILALARTLGLDAVAEGVETPEQLAELMRLGCPHAQGFLFSHPLDADAAATLLRSTDLPAA